MSYSSQSYRYNEFYDDDLRRFSYNPRKCERCKIAPVSSTKAHYCHGCRPVVQRESWRRAYHSRKARLRDNGGLNAIQ
jgi:hypothetical protein